MSHGKGYQQKILIFEIFDPPPHILPWILKFTVPGPAPLIFPYCKVDIAQKIANSGVSLEISYPRGFLSIHRSTNPWIMGVPYPPPVFVLPRGGRRGVWRAHTPGIS